MAFFQENQQLKLFQSQLNKLLNLFQHPRNNVMAMRHPMLKRNYKDLEDLLYFDMSGLNDYWAMIEELSVNLIKLISLIHFLIISNNKPVNELCNGNPLILQFW